MAIFLFPVFLLLALGNGWQSRASRPIISKKVYMKLCMLSPDERPREKLRERGVSALSNADLLAIILRTGTGKKNVLEVARTLLAAYGNRLDAVARLTAPQLCEIGGIGKDKAASLIATFELVRRIMKQEPERDITKISEAREVFLYLEPLLKWLDHEECWLVYLTRNMTLIGVEKLTSGTPESTGVDNQMIIARTLARKAAKLIIVHNHPEGNPSPSQEDIMFTMILKSALQTVKVKLLDHIIIGEKGFFSFAEEQLIRLGRCNYKH